MLLVRAAIVIITPYSITNLLMNTFGAEVLPEVYWRKQRLVGLKWRAGSS